MNLKSATSLTPKILASGQLVDTADHILYTVPPSGAAIIKQGVACNVSGVDVSFTLRIIPAAAPPADATRTIISSFLLKANDSLGLTDLLADAQLDAGDSVHAAASSGAAIDITITGIEVA